MYPVWSPWLSVLYPFPFCCRVDSKLQPSIINPWSLVWRNEYLLVSKLEHLLCCFYNSVAQAMPALCYHFTAPVLYVCHNTWRRGGHGIQPSSCWDSMAYRLAPIPMTDGWDIEGTAPWIIPAISLLQTALSLSKRCKSLNRTAGSQSSVSL